MKKIQWMITVMVFAFLLLPTGKAEAGTKAGKKFTIRLEKSETGKTVKTSKIKWKTSDKAVVKVQKKAGGRAVLSAKKEGKKRGFSVTTGDSFFIRCPKQMGKNSKKFQKIF